MDEEAEGDLPNVNNSTTMSTDMTLDAERTNNRDSHDDTRSLLPFRTNSPELTRHSVNLSRGSYDHQGSDDSHARLIDVQRGAAPAYETIDLNATEEPAPVYSRPNSQSARMSGFFNRFMPHRGNNDATSEPPILPPPPASRNSTLPPSHTRGLSLQSGISGVVSADSHEPSRRSRAGRTHRAGSSVGSVFTLFSRPVSKNHDDGPMTSPSMISLNSISPPLTHTATRTEFAFPRTGPTSEQVKFLSSKETFGRFSVPYGPDAVAFVASSSRPDLPPDFDSIHRSSIGDLSPDPDSGPGPSLSRPASTRRISTDTNSDRGDSPDPTSLTDQPPPLSRRDSSPSLRVDSVTAPLRIPLSKQKSTPNLGMGHPSLLKSVLKSKSVTNIQSDEDGTLPPRHVSAAGSYLTVDSFQTAHDDGDGSVPSPALGPTPHIMVQLPSNNPSLANLTEGSSSESEEFYDGEEGTSGNERGSANRRGKKTSKAAFLNQVHQSRAKERNQVVNGDKSSAPGNNPKRPWNAQIYSSSSGSDSGSDHDVGTRLNGTGVDKTLVTADLETSYMHEGTDVTLTQAKVAIALKASTPDLTKTTVEVSRTAAIGA